MPDDPNPLREAMGIMQECEPFEDDMLSKDHTFFTSMKGKVRQYGVKTIVSRDQLKWLRDIRAQFVED